MTAPIDHPEISRRKFLAMGGTIAAAGALGSLGDGEPAFAGRGGRRWPDGRLGRRDAIRVNEREFMPVKQFKRWNRELDRVGPANQRGLRAAGSRAEQDYLDELHELLERAGVSGLRFERVPMERWTTDRWSLELLEGAEAGRVRVASYIPYSGRTTDAGVSGELTFVADADSVAPGSMAGKIAVFEVPVTAVPLSFFTALAYPDALYDPNGELVGSRTYRRPYLSQKGVIEMIEALERGGAAGAVGIIDYPAAGADGSYFPYDGVIRNVPGLYVDREVGAGLKAHATAGRRAQLRLPAKVKRVRSRNLIGFIPGQSRELVALHCHTDGSNAIEDNGPGAIVAMAQYMARLPKKALPRTIMILLTTGHFAGGSGSQAFLERHRNDLVKRTNAALTIEHLGLEEWDELPGGAMGPTGLREPGAVFAPGSAALVKAAHEALARGKASPAGVLKPLNPAAVGHPEEDSWPGEGQYLYTIGGISDANYITGPTYLLNWGIETVSRCNHRRVRAESIAFTEMILRLGRTPRNELRNYTL